MRGRLKKQLSFVLTLCITLCVFSQAGYADNSSNPDIYSPTFGPEDSSTASSESTSPGVSSSGASSSGAPSSSGTSNTKNQQQEKDKLNNQLSGLQSEYKKLEQQQQQLKKDIAAAKNEKEKQLAIKKQLNNQIYITEQQIKILEEKIRVTEENILVLEELILAKQQDIEANYDKFKKRLRALYMTDTATTIELILGAGNFYDFLVKSEMTKRVTDHDKELIAELGRQKESIESDKREVEQYKQDLETDKREIDIKKAELADSLTGVNTQINNLSALEKEKLSQEAKILEAMQEAKREMDAIFKQMQSFQADYVGGEFTWPLPGYKTITSYFGQNRGYYNSAGQWVGDVHTGTDISGSGVSGKNIVAANSGVVYMATYSNVGYGNYVIIDHGGGRSTLYAHCSSLNVSKGQSVEKGQVIATVGSTGNSTGPHLHFEVRISGQAVNPMQYFK